MFANEILQRFLDEMGEAVMTERFEAYHAGVELPLSIVTSTANLIIETVEDLVEGFDDFCDIIQSQGVTDMPRRVMEARFDGEDRIVGIYETNLMNGAHRVVPTFYSKMWLRRVDGVWQANRIQNTTRNARWPILLYQVEEAHASPKELLK